MRFIDDFFSITETENTPDGLRCRVRLNVESEIYKSHFPGNPVTPGACLVQIAGEILEHSLRCRLSLTAIPKIRFKQVVLPNDDPWFAFTGITEDDGTLNVAVVVSIGQTECAKMSLKYAVLDAENTADKEANAAQEEANTASKDDKEPSVESVCVVIPTYNNAKTIVKVVQDASQYCKNIIVVNDGCTDETHDLLSALDCPVTLIEFGRNRGKGCAIVAGLRKATAMGFTHALTMDSDGQHFASDIPAFLAAMRDDRASIIVGSRCFDAENMPRQNTFANRFSNVWFRLQTGTSLPDTQSGFRLYPIDHLCSLRLITSRYEGELALLVFSAWRGTTIRSIPVKVYYPAKEERISHFRPVCDFVRISVLNTVLCVVALFYGWPSLLLRKIRKG